LLPEWGQNARYSPSGHLVFYRAGDLVVVGFDRRRLLTQGPAVPLIREIYTCRDENLLAAMSAELREHQRFVYTEYLQLPAVL